MRSFEATYCRLAALKDHFLGLLFFSAQIVYVQRSSGAFIKRVHINDVKSDRSTTVEHITDLRFGCLKAYKL